MFPGENFGKNNELPLLNMGRLLLKAPMIRIE